MLLSSAFEPSLESTLEPTFDNTLEPVLESKFEITLQPSLHWSLYWSPKRGSFPPGRDGAAFRVNRVHSVFSHLIIICTIGFPYLSFYIFQGFVNIS